MQTLARSKSTRPRSLSVDLVLAVVVGLVATLITIEQLGAGFGNAALAVFIMRTTKASFKAAHFAIGTGLMNIAGTLAGVFSGFLASAVGFPIFFGLTFLLAIPNMALIPWLPFARDGANS